MSTERLLPRLKIDKLLIIFIAFFVALDIYTGKSGSMYLFSVIYFSVYVHELAHSFAGRYFGYATEYININTCGGFCKFKDDNWLENSRPQFFIAVSGPLSNLLLGAALLPIDHNASYLNIIFACFNLIPMMPMDGGHILWAILKKYTVEHVYILHTLSTLVGMCAMYFFRKEIIAFVVLSLFTLANALQSARSDNE